MLSFLNVFRKDVTAADVHSPSAIRNQPEPSISGKKNRPSTEVIEPLASAQIVKVDDSLGLVLGWAIISKRDGADYFDLQDDHIPEEAMLAAAVDFMQSGAMAKEMHAGGGKGTVLFAFPMTTDIAKAFGIETKTTGLMIGMKPDSAEMLGKFRDGTYKGFSIGGSRLTDEEVA